jgi:phosphatidylserine/phosphatidylglycerophosphate/cardiolipin synthase-like enzyme
VIAASGLELANGGERLVLSTGRGVVDTVVYERAPEGERLVRDAEGRRWLPVGYEPRPAVERGAAQVTAFVLPDAPGVTIDTLRAADDRILLAGYTLTSDRVTRALVSAADRGVRVHVLVDDAPVGGLSRREARMLDRLARGGVEVRVIGGEGERFSYHHPKYAVVDHTALVLTENWKPSGTGGRSSRGWGVRVDSPALAGDLAELFANDIEGRDTTAWTRFRRGRGFAESDPVPEQRFPTRHEPERLRTESIRLLTAPGNAEGNVVGVFDRAEGRIDVVQVSVERDHPFVTAAFDAARRGVKVRILLSGAWYVREENGATVAWLNRRAEREGLPLEARVAEPGKRFEKVHAKGVVADDTVLVGSLNWNRHASRENREVVVVLEGEEVAGYYRTVFEADWRGGGGAWGRVGALAGVAGVAVVAGVVLARRGARGRRRGRRRRGRGAGVATAAVRVWRVEGQRTEPVIGAYTGFTTAVERCESCGTLPSKTGGEGPVRGRGSGLSPWASSNPLPLRRGGSADAEAR